MEHRRKISKLPRCQKVTNPSAFVRQDPAPQALRSPDAGTQAFKLHNLAMIDKQVYFRTVILDVPGKDLWIRSLKHDLLDSERVRDLRRDVRAPHLHVFGDAF